MGDQAGKVQPQATPSNFLHALGIRHTLADTPWQSSTAFSSCSYGTAPSKPFLALPLTAAVFRISERRGETLRDLASGQREELLADRFLITS